MLDENACVAKRRGIDAKLMELRAQRRRLMENEEIEDMCEAIRRIVQELRSGEDCLKSFDEEVFRRLVERITVESNTRIVFKLHGGIELPEEIER